MTRHNLEVTETSRKSVRCKSLCYFINHAHVLITKEYTVASTAILTEKNTFIPVVFNYLATLPKEEGKIFDNHMMLSLNYAVQ